jgi:polyisoprenoid-binding protein YceI
MPTVTEREGEVRIFTFKDGLLSAVAHDLEIAVERFHIGWDDARTEVTARFDATSLRVLHAIVRGSPAPSSLSARELRTIEENIQRDVLATSRHPEVRFVSTSIADEASGPRIDGTLTLHGRARPLSVRTSRVGGRLVAEITLDQREFGITPYRAMMGTLKIKPELRIVVRVPG